MRARRRTAVARTAATACLAAAGACADGGAGGRDAAAAWGGTVDTLEGGVVRVANPAGALWDSAAAWRLVEDLRIGAEDGGRPEMFADVHDVAVDGSGRIHVLQRQTPLVQVFDASGRHVRTIGRAGAGPGEFAQPNGLAFDPAGRLWVADPGNARFVAFDGAGALVAARRRDLGGYGFRWHGTFLRDGRLVEGDVGVPRGDRRAIALVRFDTAFSPVDTLLAAPIAAAPESRVFAFHRGDAATYVEIPFVPAPSVVVDPRGYAWELDPARYALVQRTLDGDTVRVVTREYTPVPVADADLAWLRDATAKLGPVDESRIPRVKPAFTAAAVAPDGTLWVRLERPHGELPAFEVFDTAGRALGTVASPVPIATHDPLHLTADALHVVTRDDADVPYVVRLRIVRP